MGGGYNSWVTMHSDPQTSLAELRHAGLIRVSGADAVAFLQGQLSTDLDKLTPIAHQLSSWNNAKGRVVTLLRLFRRGDDICMSLPAALQPTVLKRLGMYVLRSKVALTDASSHLVCLGLMGDRAHALLAKAGLSAPEVNALSSDGAVQILRLHGQAPRFEIYGDPAAMAALQSKLSEAGAKTADEDQWALQTILAGEPTIYPETSEHFVAQMLGLDELGGIDYKKGCYIGQEVIARAHYRGGVKRHLVRAEAQAGTALKPGTELQAKGATEPVAEVVDARRDAQGRWQLLAVLQDEYRDAELACGATSVKVLAA